MVCSTETPAIPLFLSKCYDMVDDPATDGIICWGSSGTSLVIHDIVRLQKEVFHKYYKHSNLSSFIRQLHVYGFKKYDPAKLEYTNEMFIKGQKHMLRYLRRKKSSQGNCLQDQSQENSIFPRRNSLQDCQHNPLLENTSNGRKKSSLGKFESIQSQENTTIASRKSSVGNNQLKEPQGNNNFGGAFVEVGNFKLWEDVENLKKEKVVAMQELAKLRHHQQGADGELDRLGKRVQGLEVSQQQLMSFLAMIVEGKLIRTNESTRLVSKISKKRSHLAFAQDTDCTRFGASDGQIVTYQATRNETAKATTTLPFSGNEHQQLDSSVNELDDFFENIDLMPSGECMAMAMEDDRNHENEDHFVIPCSIEDEIMDRLLLTSAPPERNETSEADPVRVLENNMNLEIDSCNTHEEPSD